jgi:enterochelin esterase-like enzyme
MTAMTLFRTSAAALSAFCAFAQPAVSQQPAPAATACEQRAPNQRPLQYRSVEPLADGRVSFRLCAPASSAASLVSPDLESVPGGFDGKPAGLAMARDAQGFWQVSTPTAVPAGRWRYGFQIDGMVLPDPQGSQHSELARGVRSVFDMAGAGDDPAAWRPGIPHGQVATIEYVSLLPGVVRRAHVYTPPGYEAGGSQRYPVLYLVHGYGDSDDSWTSIGLAHRILDALIASGKARPMIVVMPNGHTPDRAEVASMNNTDFGDDLHQVLIPLVDGRFRTLKTAKQRAMAGLSMGGMHTLNFGLPRPDVFGAIGVFSMGAGVGAPAALDDYRQRHAQGLKQRARQAGLVFYAYGKTDFIYALAAPTRQLLDEFKIRHTWYETEGGHTWANWRHYLAALAPQLFR